MNILVIIHNQSSTGPFFKVREMCVAISDVGNTVSLLCTSENARFRIKRYSYKNIQIIEAPDILWGKFRQGIDVWNSFIRILIVRNIKIDIVHIIDSRPVVIIPALYLKYFRSLPIVMSWYDYFSIDGTILERSGILYSRTFGRVEQYFDRFFRKNANSSIAVTKFLQNKLIDLGIPKESISIIPVGCVYKEYPENKNNKNIFNFKKHTSTSDKLLCYAGNIFGNDKQLLINSLTQIIKINKTNNIKTILIGNHILPKSLIKDLNIIVTGRLNTIEEVYAYLRSCHYGIIPMMLSQANLARWPSKIGDYFCAGLPVITTPVSDFKEIFDQYHLGFVSTTDSSESICNSIEEAFNIEEKQYKILSMNCRKYAQNNLEWSVLSKNIIKCYNYSMNN